METSTMSESNGDGKLSFDEVTVYKTFDVKKRNGKVETYTVQDAGPEYWDATAEVFAAQAKIRSGESAGVLAMRDAQDKVIGLCVTDATGKLLDPKKVGWGVKLRASVFTLCEEACGMTRAAVETEKKDLPAEEKSGGGTKSPAVSGAA